VVAAGQILRAVRSAPSGFLARGAAHREREGPGWTRASGMIFVVAEEIRLGGQVPASFVLQRTSRSPARTVRCNASHAPRHNAGPLRDLALVPRRWCGSVMPRGGDLREVR
jgi:hypothetical protein